MEGFPERQTEPLFIFVFKLKVLLVLEFPKGVLMPIFEYVCQNCGKEFERLVFRSDEVVECPECGQQSVNKLMSACAAKIGYKFTSASKPADSCSGCSSTSCSSCG